LLKTRLNGKVLADTDANRQMMESMLAPHESPSAAIYETIALSYPQKFAWQTPRRVQSEAERRADFETTCRQNNLSLCSANEQLHKDSVGIEHWAGASQIELQRFQSEAAQARQKFLTNDATPDELKQEARYESQVNREAAIKSEALRREAVVAQAQNGLYPPLPALSPMGEPMDKKFFCRISTTDYPRFKALVKRYGSSQITAVLRGER
jgi:hypothetical protein